MDNELLRNGSGYVDLTAYKALKKIENGGSKMKRGEIWEIAGIYENRMVVVVEAHEGFCSVLMLNLDRKKEDDVEIVARGKMYTNPAMISYTFNDRFITFVRRMKDEEFASLMHEVDKCFSMISFVASAEPKEVLEEDAEKEEMKVYIMKLEAEIKELEAVNKVIEEQKEIAISKLAAKGTDLAAGHNEELMKLKIERDTYLNLYNGLLEKMIG